MPEETLNAAKVIRRVRGKLEVSQEGLARLLNATKGAIQHWERGRNNPDLARLLALRQLCPSGLERKGLDQLIKQTQARVAPLSIGKTGGVGTGKPGQRGPMTPSYPAEGLVLLRRENHRLQRRVAKLETMLKRRAEQVRILEDLAGELQKEVAGLKAGKTPVPEPSPSTATPPVG